MQRPARRPSRADARSTTTPPAIRWAALLLATLASTGCATYEQVPLDPTLILDGLRSVAIPMVLDAPSGEQTVDDDGTTPDTTSPAVAFDPSDGFSIDEAVAVALQLNPALAATRARLHVARAQLIQAGLFPDPTLGWDLNEGNAQISLPLLRPDELDSRVAIGDARVDEARWTVVSHEWRLGRDVHLAILDLLGTREQIALNAQLGQAVSRSQDYFSRARSLGAAMALDEETAAIQAARVRADAVRLAAQERRAELALNALLGLPPTADFDLEPGLALPAVIDTEPPAADALTEQALAERPDLLALMAVYAQAEANLRLAVAQQWPKFAIGTTVQFLLAVFSDFNDPAIQTAIATRTQVEHEVIASVHALRAEVHDAVAALEQSQGELALLTEELAPRLDESLRLVELAVKAGQVTASEILLAQSQVLQARVQLLDTQIEAAKRAATAHWVSGRTEIER